MNHPDHPQPGLAQADPWCGLRALTPARIAPVINCVSNIRPEGLGYEAAAARLHYLMTEARRRKLSGVALKDETGELQG